MGVLRVLPGMAALALVVAAPAHAETVACTGTDTPVNAGDRTEAIAAVVCLVDRERATRGLPRLAVESRVAASAQSFAEHLATRSEPLSHEGTGSVPRTPKERLAQQGYAAAFEGETIGQGHRTPRQIVNQWLHSKLHCSIMLSAAGPQYPSLGPIHIGVGSAGPASSPRWVMQVALPEGAADPGYPGHTPSCPVGSGDHNAQDATAPENAEVKPFVRHDQTGTPGGGGGGGGGAGGGGAGGGGGGGGGVAGGGGPPAGGPVALTVPALPSSGGILRSGQSRRLTIEAAPGSVLRVTVKDAAGRTRALGTATPVPGVAATQPGAAVFLLPAIRVVTAVTVTVTDGRTTVSRRLMPLAVLRSVRASRRAGRVRVTGRLRPALKGKRVRIMLTRGKSTRRQVVRTRKGGRFAANVRPPRGSGVVRIRVVAIRDPKRYAQAVAVPRPLRLAG